MRTLTTEQVTSLCDIIHNEPDQRIKNRLAAWADQYVNNYDSNIDFGLLSSFASQSKVKGEIDLWISNTIGNVSITIPEPITETVVETPNTVVIDVPEQEVSVEEPLDGAFEGETERLPDSIIFEQPLGELTEEPIIEKPKRKRKSL